MRTVCKKEEIDLMVELYNQGYSAAAICKQIPYAPHTILDKLRKRGVEIRSRAGYKKPFNENYFENIDTEKKAYFLGFLMADGCVYERKKSQPCMSFQLKSSDKYILEELKKELDTDNTIDYYAPKDHSSLRICSTKIVNDLFKYGIVYRKTGYEKFPKDLIPENLINHFVRGFFDGDGWVTLTKSHGKEKKRISIGFTSNEKMLISLRDYFKEKLNGDFNVNPHIYNNEQKGYKGFGLITFSKKSDVKILRDWMYQNATIFLTRKYDVFTSASSLISSGLNQQSV